MKVTIIGRGNMARALGTCFVTGGHRLAVAGRELDKAKPSQNGSDSPARPTRLGCQLCDAIVLLAIRYAVLHEVIEQIRDQLDKRVLVDMVNPIAPTYDALVEVWAGSVAEEIAQTLPSARVVKAFSTAFHDTLLAPPAVRRSTCSRW
jgi:predicted dinucleotide-binding enzyme